MPSLLRCRRCSVREECHIPDANGFLTTSYAACAAFTALLPVGEARLVPGIIRAATAVALTPFAATQLHAFATATPGWSAGTHGQADLVLAAVAGAATGLAASAITATAAAAGALFDQTLSGGPGGALGEHGGPISFLFSLSMGLLMC